MFAKKVHHVFKFNCTQIFYLFYQINFGHKVSLYKIEKYPAKKNGVVKEINVFGMWFIQSSHSNAFANVRYVFQNSIHTFFFLSTADIFHFRCARHIHCANVLIVYEMMCDVCDISTIRTFKRLQLFNR